VTTTTVLGTEPIVELRDIRKDFPGVRALDHVSFSVWPGEIHALVGKNGAGKSTLMNILTGIYPPDAGEIWLDGERVEAMTPARARDGGIFLVAQHARYIPSLSIAENIFCGDLPRTRAGFIDWHRLYGEAQERLERMGLAINVRLRMEGLSVAERQMIEIARALFADARVIVLDEPTAPLPKHDTSRLFDFIRRQRQAGTAFIYISHYLEEVFELADRVTVLRNGQLVGTYPVSQLTQSELIRLISGTEIEHFQRPSRLTHGEAVLTIRGLRRPGVYDDIDVTLHAGEIVGLTGLEGCGNSALARGLFGLEPLGEGEVRLAGQPYHADHPYEALHQGVAYLPRDRHGLGIIPNRSVRDNITLAILRQLVGLLGFIRADREREVARGFVERLGIKTSSLRQPVESLSGGNQQKVVVAKLVATRPKVLLLDEPTQGVDVQAKVEILKIIDELTREGVAAVVISDELSELTDICDRIVVMYRGKIVDEFRRGEPRMTPHEILEAIEGGAGEHVA